MTSFADPPSVTLEAMARFEQDREDIIREATALVRRIEFQLPGFAEPVTVGFRRDGSASFYFGPDLVLQFNSRNELRRGYNDGQLIKAESGHLVSMKKKLSENVVELRSRTLTDDEQEIFLRLCELQLCALQTAFQNKTIKVLRQVPEKMDIADEVALWLALCAKNVSVARSPNAR